MQFHVLGPLEVCTPDTRIELRATKPGALLSVLLVNASAWVGVDQLIDGIWHEQAVPASAVRNLRSYVWQLRQTLGDRLESRPGGYRIKVLLGELDTEAVETLAESARAAMAAGAYGSAVETLTEALARWRGTPFEGFTFDAALSVATRFGDLRAELSCLLADARKLMRTGLGVEPGPELVAAQRKILRERNPAKSTKLSLVAGSGPRPSGIDAFLASATSEVLIMTTGTGPGRIDAIRRISQANLRPGVRYRVLCPDSARLSGLLSGLSLAGVEVRTDAEVPMEAVVVNRTSALLPGHSGAGNSSGLTVFSSPGVVTATVGLFERIWPGAVPLIPVELTDAGEATVLNQRERDLLTLLCAGSTDESAAARLDISVRTVRRMVADIMNRLGARSRFQAGVKAADRGWLLDKAS